MTGIPIEPIAPIPSSVRMSKDLLAAASLDAESAPMIRVLDDLLRDPRTPMVEVYAYIDFCVDLFSTSAKAKQMRVAFAQLRDNAQSRRERLIATRRRQ
jgi:hypothetical protein